MPETVHVQDPLIDFAPPCQTTPFDIIRQIKNDLERLLDRMHTEVLFAIRILRLCKAIQRVCHLDENAVLGTLFLEHTGRYSVNHPVNTALICELVSKTLGFPLPKRFSLLAASLTMNISMVSLQDTLFFQKEPLTPSQKEEIYRHPEKGVEKLRRYGVKDKIWLDAVHQHHKFLDGSGYPEDVQIHAIADAARILSIADIFCAKISNRGYRLGLLPNTGLRELFLVERNQHVDLEMVTQLIKVVGIYPPGTLVRLINGELAVVTHRGEKAHQPLVQVVASPKGIPLTEPVLRDCSFKKYGVKETLSSTSLKSKINPYRLWGYEK